MKPASFLLLSTFLLGGCGDNIPAPELPDETVSTLDGPYLVSIEWAASTCDEAIADMPKLGIVDVYLRTDGTVNLKSTLNVPMPMTFRNVTPGTDGAVAFRYDAVASYGTFVQEANGTLTPTSIDLAIESDDEGFSRQSKCHRTFRITGTPARIHDPRGIDGYHQVALTLRQPWCPDKPGTPSAAEPIIMTVVSIDDEHALISMQWMDAVVPIPRRGGTFDWKGTGTVGGLFGLEQVDVRIFGRMDRSRTDLTFIVPDSADTECGYLFRTVGAKRAPSAASVDNDYRTVVDWTDPCKGTAGRYDSPTRLIVVKDGLLLDEGGFLPTHLKASDDGTYNDQQGSEANGWTVSYQAWVQPPRLSYEVLKRYRNTETGEWCEVHAAATGVARYLK